MPDDRPMPLTGEDEIPEDVVLGKPVANYPSRRLRALLIGWSILIGTALIVNIGLWNVYDEAWVGPVVVLIFGVIAQIIGWWIMHIWNRELIMYEKGFTYREGSRNVPFMYTEVKSIRVRAEQISYFGGLLRRTIYHIFITAHSGDQIRIDNTYRRVSGFGDRLLKEVNPILRPIIRYRIEQGEAVPFTPFLSVTNEGIHVDAAVLENMTEDAHLPWPDYYGYKVAQRQLALMTTEQTIWFEVPLVEIENLALLLEILNEHGVNVKEAKTV